MQINFCIGKAEALVILSTVCSSAVGSSSIFQLRSESRMAEERAGWL